MSKACPAGAYGARHPVIVGKRLDVSILRQFPINLVSSFFFCTNFFFHGTCVIIIFFSFYLLVYLSTFLPPEGDRVVGGMNYLCSDFISNDI